jgi:hypothetical protein
MTQGILPFKYENDKQNNKLTGFGSLQSYPDLAQAAGLPKSINHDLSVSSDSQGWTDNQLVIATERMALNTDISAEHSAIAYFKSDPFFDFNIRARA